VIKPDQTSQFEEVWKLIKGRMASSDKPDLKAMGDGLKVYKMPAQPGQPVRFLLLADPSSKTLTYEPSPFLIYNSGLFPERKEAEEVYNKLAATIQGLEPMPLVVIAK